MQGAQELYQPCEDIPSGLINVEQVQSHAHIVSEQVLDRSREDSSHTICQFHQICLHAGRIDNLLAGEAERGGSNFYRKSSRTPKQPSIYSGVVIHHCNRGPADNSTDEPEVIDPNKRPQHGPGTYRSKVKNNESAKVGCKVHFSARRPVAAPGVMVVKWAVGSTHHVGHGTEAHTAVRGTADQFPSRISEELRTWVAQQLRIGVQVSKILEV